MEAVKAHNKGVTKHLVPNGQNHAVKSKVWPKYLK